MDAILTSTTTGLPKGTHRVSSPTYPGHSHHELHHKSLEASHDISNKRLITEHRFLTGIQLDVQELDKMAYLGPRGVMQTT